jgi:plasmid maintenance system antidote protein VapI
VSISTANTFTTGRQEDFALQAKTRLLEHGLTVTALAAQLGLARNTVSIAINHPSMLPSVKRRIRKALGL